MSRFSDSPPLAGAPGRAPAESRHILVVDDQPAIRDLLARILRGAGYRVSCAGDGEAGWEALCSQPFDALVTDHEMPRLTGLDLLRRMRAGGLNTVPALLISGRMPWGEGDLPRLLAPGMALEKPFPLGQFLARVKSILIPSNRENEAGGQPALSPVYRDLVRATERPRTAVLV